MDRINAIALLYLLKTDTSHLSGLADYIEQFDFVVKNIIALDDNKNS